MVTWYKSKKKLLAVIIIIALVMGVIGLCIYLYDRGVFVSSDDVAELWPENGPVVATIDGKEYRYDPVYLYRLTGCVFPEDPWTLAMISGQFPTTGAIDPTDTSPTDTADIPSDYIISWDMFNLNSESAIFNPVGIPGITMAENAILFELQYREQVNKPIDRDVTSNLIRDGRRGTMESVSAYFHEKYSGLSEEEAQKQALSELGPIHPDYYQDANSYIAYYLMMEKAKFKEGQSTDSYLKEASPYIKKHSFIASYSTPKLYPEDSESPASLLKKYNDSLMEKYNVEMVE